MHVISQCSHSFGKLLRIWNYLSSDEISIYLPTVIDVKILIAFGSQSGLHQQISSFADDCLINVASKVIPGVPPHGRSATESVV